MANPLKGEAVLTLEDGRSFTLVLDFDGLIEAEQAYGKPLAAVLAEAQSGFMGAIRALIWGALRRHHRDVSMSDAGEILLNAKDEAVAAIMAAIEATMPAKDPGGNAPGKPETRPAGKSSGGNGAKPGSTRKGSAKKPRAALA